MATLALVATVDLTVFAVVRLSPRKTAETVVLRVNLMLAVSAPLLSTVALRSSLFGWSLPYGSAQISTTRLCWVAPSFAVKVTVVPYA